MSKKPYNLKARLTTVLRKVFLWSPLRRDVLKKAILPDETFNCSICGRNYHRLLAKIDHISPVIEPKIGFVDWNTYIERLFCISENLQVCCITCHKAKTKVENDDRKKYGTGKSSAKNKAILSSMRKGLPQTPAREAVRARMIRDKEKAVIVTNVLTGDTEEFPSVAAASCSLNIQACNISRVCNARQGRTQVEGYICHWKSRGAK